MKMQTNIFLKYLSERNKKKNLLRRLSDILSFMLLQNKYKKCDYCLLLLSLFCVVCVLFLLFKSPLTNDPLSQACPSPGRQGRTQHKLHTRLVCCVLFSFLSCLGSSYVVFFSIFLFLFLSSSICFFSLYRHSLIGQSTSRLPPSRPAHTTLRFLFRYLFRSLYLFFIFYFLFVSFSL
jgi:hypothetical protein